MCWSGDRVTIVTGGPGRWRLVHAPRTACCHVAPLPNPLLAQCEGDSPFVFFVRHMQRSGSRK
jgi:hypothetical protein